MEDDYIGDKFDFSFRILGNEIVGMSLTSNTKAKNMIALVVVLFVAVGIFIGQVGPLAVDLINQEKVSTITVDNG